MKRFDIVILKSHVEIRDGRDDTIVVEFYYQRFMYVSQAIKFARLLCALMNELIP